MNLKPKCFWRHLFHTHSLILFASLSAYAQQKGDFAGLVAIGDGRKMYLECRGSGSPTVILESGYRNDAAIWSAPLEPGMTTVFPQVAKFTRVCAYDRPGTFLDANHLSRSSTRRMSQDPMSSPRIPLVAFLPAYTPALIRMRLSEWFWLMRCPKR